MVVKGGERVCECWWKHVREGGDGGLKHKWVVLVGTGVIVVVWVHMIAGVNVRGRRKSL